MSGQEKSVPQLPVANQSLLATDYFVCVSNASGNSVTTLVPINQALANTANCSLIPFISIPPASSAAMNVATGVVWTDGNYLYVSTAPNVTKRVALSSF